MTMRPITLRPNGLWNAELRVTECSDHAYMHAAVTNMALEAKAAADGHPVEYEVGDCIIAHLTERSRMGVRPWWNAKIGDKYTRFWSLDEARDFVREVRIAQLLVAA